MANPEHLRMMAERILALAIKSSNEEVARGLPVKACEYLDQAAALEGARPAVSEAPQHRVYSVFSKSAVAPEILGFLAREGPIFQRRLVFGDRSFDPPS
jgi:hypothetical protein